MAMLVLGDVVDNQGITNEPSHCSGGSRAIPRDRQPHLARLTLAFLGSLAQRRGRRDCAESLMDEALDLSREIGFLWGTAISLNRLGRLAAIVKTTCGRRSTTGKPRIWRELGDHWRMTRSLIDLADVASADRQFERAARLLGAAEAINEPIGASESFCRRLGATARAGAPPSSSTRKPSRRLGNGARHVVGRSRRRGDRHREPEWDISEQHQRPPTIRAGYGLTARELEVLRLLVAGHTDRQIAEELFISRRTAQGHVASIFNKLGVNSRTAAATAALRDGLVDRALLVVGHTRSNPHGRPRRLPPCTCGSGEA